MKVAVITGASSGLGKEFARQIAEKYPWLDEIWVVARTESKLKQLQKQLPVQVRIFPLDLRRKESIGLLRREMEQRQVQLYFLVNASGLGKFGEFSSLTEQEIDDMIQLDVLSLIQLTKAALPFLRRGARVLEISSASAFLPLSGFAVYGAAKSMVLQFSRALARELRHRGITVTAVCPYWVKTNFIAVAKDTQQPDAIKHFPFAAEAPQVVKKALADCEKGKDVSSYGVGKLIRGGAKLLPQKAVMSLWEKIR